MTNTVIHTNPVRNTHRVLHTGDGFSLSFIVCECGATWSGKYYPGIRKLWNEHVAQLSTDPYTRSADAP